MYEEYSSMLYQHNNMTDGKSILSGPVLIEQMAGEQKHLETMLRLMKALEVENTTTYTGQSTGTNTVKSWPS